MNRRDGALASAFIALLALLPVIGCASESPSSGGFPPGYGTGGATGAGASTGAGAFNGTGGVTGQCLTNACLPPLDRPTVWDVQIDPPSSSSYALAQVLAQDVSSSAPYRLSKPTTVTLTFSAAFSTQVPASANVMLTVPPLIMGRPDIVYQAPAQLAGGGTSTAAMLQVPSDTLGLTGSISLVPLSPSDQQLPPYVFSDQVVASTIWRNLPSGDVLVSGQVTDSVQTTQSFLGTPFIARVFQNGMLVSNAPSSQADGTFQLRVPAAAVADQVTLDLRSSAALPWLVSMPFIIIPGRNLGTISLPAFIPANGFRVGVVDGAVGIGGVVVRAQAVLGTTSGSNTVSGTAQYTTSGTTDASGNVTLQLLPGPGNAPVSYLLAAMPPAGSRYATQCTSVDVLAGGPSGGLLQKFVATLRPVVTGTVRTASGIPLPNVTITANGTPDGSLGCPPPDPVTAVTSTDASGAYTLPLEPGTYQLDYDPPVGSAAPRLTEVDVAVQGNTVPHDVNLPAGALVTGYVVGTLNEPVPSATVRFFEQRCNNDQGQPCSGPFRTPPWLRAKALTDARGQFRMAVPVPAQP